MQWLPLFLAAGSLCAQPVYDLLLKGGQVIDPKNKISARRDVAIAGGRIAEVAASIPPAKAHKTIDVSGLYVTPGLVDIHVHVFATGGGSQYVGALSVWPDGHTFRNGVTTVVDAGTSGWRNFPLLRDTVIAKSRTRVLAMLNIVGRGMGGENEQDTNDMNAKATAEMAIKNKSIVVGIKTAHYAGPEWTAVDRAEDAATIANIPVMVDFGTFREERPFSELVTKKLRPGDIYTHFYLPWVPMFDGAGKVQPFLWEARKRGVIFDVGHGGGSFVFRHAANALKQGLAPDSISTDLHVHSMNSGMKGMLNVMSKFLNLGMTLDDIILRTTVNPAHEIKRDELGTLSVGADADVAVLKVEHGTFGFTDSLGARMTGAQRLECELTLRAGKMEWDLNGISREDWRKLPPKYESQADPKWDATIAPNVPRVKK
jgi:dihydroorotase